MSRSDKGLEIIQEEDIQPYKNTSKEHNEVTPIKVEPQNVRVPIHKYARIPQAPDRYGYYVDIEEYELGDLNEPPNYKAALANPESDKWLEDMHTETFSHVADIRAIRILLAIAAFYDYEIWKIDVKTAFLNGHLSKDVYMVQLEEFVDPTHPNKVCKLQRFIYGLKQASRSWNKSRSNVAFLVLYVDDILLMGNSVTMLQEVKSWPCMCFFMKDLGEAAYFLGIKIICDKSKRLIALSQSAYLEKILKKFRMESSKKGYTPIIEKPDYKKSQGAKTPTKKNPGEIHSTAMKTILKYLRNTKDMVLVYGAKPKDELKVSCYADAKAEYIAATKASMEAVTPPKWVAAE
ncbi:retrotransposon protein, putative, ty1-copia subclass [Tanacetum coccineum]